MMFRQANIAGKRILQVLTCNVHIVMCNVHIVLYNVHIVMCNVEIVEAANIAGRGSCNEDSAECWSWTLDTRDVIQICEIFSIRCLSGFPHLKSIIRTLCKMDIYYLNMVSPPKIVTLVLSAKLMINWGFVQQKSSKTKQ